MSPRVFFIFVALLVMCCCNTSNLVVGKKPSVRFNNPNGGDSILRDQLQLAQNMCVMGLRGKKCGKGNSEMTLANGETNLLVAGYGYDRWTHQVKPQILASKNVNAIETQVKSISASITNARDFFSLVYPISGQSQFFNGIYSHNAGADEIFSRFFEGSFNVYDSQMQYTTHQVSSYDTLNTTLLFKRIIEILPSTMSESMYQQVIDVFGDSVMVNVDYGGVVDSTVSVRECFSDPNMQNHVTNELSSIISGSNSNLPDGYARYHKVALLDIVGGHPEISSIGNRASTFRNNPVPIRFQTIPIWSVFPDGEKKNNMKQIYDQYVNSKSNMANQMIQQLDNRKIEEQHKPQVFRTFYRDKGVLHEHAQYTLSLGQSFTFDSLNWILIYMATNKSPIYYWNGQSPATIFRHEDNSFHIQVEQYHPEVAAHNVNIPRILASNRVTNNCASLSLAPNPPNAKQFLYTTVQEIIVCSGGQIMLSGDQRSVIFGCPYVY